MKELIDIDRILLELQPLEHLFDNQGQILLQFPEQYNKWSDFMSWNQDKKQWHPIEGLKEQHFTKFAYPEKMPYTKLVLEDLGMYRTRAMNLRSKSCYSYHKDPTKRIHIPLVTNDNCFIIVDDILHRYPADGNHYVVDTTKQHTAVNASWEERIHLVGCFDE
tara:strand:+ start:2086 stop:2574 length:489 start_codon:yes stop_codon:yes gene_type:complete